MDFKHTLGEPRVLVSQQALLHNAAVLRGHLAPGTRMCAMIKADAYGHGAAIVADALADAADAFAVASIDEAADLVEAMPEVGAPLMIFRPLENAFVGRQRVKIEEAIRRGWVLTICSNAAAEDVARIAVASGRRAAVQVMVDTGMTRSGVSPESLDALLHRIDTRASLRLVGLCTHFASSEEAANPFNREQLQRFLRATDPYVQFSAENRRDSGTILRHAANSGAIFFAPQSHLNMVRPGVALYGVDPTLRPNLDRALRPALKWVAPLVSIQDVPAGTTVGYGQAWTAPRRTRVGLVPVGYADGYPRTVSREAVMLVHSHPCPVIGRVSMDLTTIDLTDLPQVAIGDEVTVLDCDPLSPASVYHLARCSGTVPYEVFCRIGPRVHRVAVDPVAELLDADEPAARDA